jgi:hypothetical protein
MTASTPSRWTALLLLSAGAAWAAGTPPEVPEQRARIARERAAAEAAFVERDQQCQQKFAVTSCVNEARAERRSTLERLSREQLEIDDGERKRRATERLEAIEAKQSAIAARLAASAASAAEARQAVPRRSSETPVPKPHPVKEPPNTAAAEARAAERVAARERREQEAAAHRAELEKRNAERAADHKPAKPLPLPGSSPQP